MSPQILLTACISAAILFVGAVRAQDAVPLAPDGWTPVPTAKCDDFEFAAATSEAFPEIDRACRGVVRSEEGKPYVKIAARVAYVRRDMKTREVRKVTLEMLDSEGAVLRRLTTTPPSSFRFTVDGKEYSADYLSRGTELSLYLPPDRWELVWNPQMATPIDTRVSVDEIETVLVTTSLEADETFEFDKAQISADGKAALDDILSESRGIVTSITVRGYTDVIGDEEYNLALSQRRADAVKRYLVSKGAPERRVTAEGRGELNPIVTCSDDMPLEERKQCLAPNRRTEIALLVPVVKDEAVLEVTRTYENPLGEKVTVNDELSLVQFTDVNKPAVAFLDACQAEIATYCPGIEAGSGQIVGCMTAVGGREDAEISPACESQLLGLLDAVMFRRARLDALGRYCSAELAACDAAPLADKLQCIVEHRMSPPCARVMKNITSAAF